MIALHSYKVDKDGEIRVRHTFYAQDEEEAEDLMEAHGEGCEEYGPALEMGQTIEILEENVSPPDAEALATVAEAQIDPEEEEEEDEEPGEDDEDDEPEEDEE